MFFVTQSVIVFRSEEVLLEECLNFIRLRDNYILLRVSVIVSTFGESSIITQLPYDA